MYPPGRYLLFSNRSPCASQEHSVCFFSSRSLASVSAVRALYGSRDCRFPHHRNPGRARGTSIFPPRRLLTSSDVARRALSCAVCARIIADSAEHGEKTTKGAVKRDDTSDAIVRRRAFFFSFGAIDRPNEIYMKKDARVLIGFPMQTIASFPEFSKFRPINREGALSLCLIDVVVGSEFIKRRKFARRPF